MYQRTTHGAQLWRTRLAPSALPRLLGVNEIEQVSHLMSVSSCPEGKTTMLRANVMLVAGLVGLFGEAVEDEQREDGEGHDGDDGAVQGAME